MSARGYSTGSRYRNRFPKSKGREHKSERTHGPDVRERLASQSIRHSQRGWKQGNEVEVTHNEEENLEEQTEMKDDVHHSEIQEVIDDSGEVQENEEIQRQNL